MNSSGLNLSENLLFVIIIIGFAIFFILERVIYWIHGHAHQKEEQLVCYDTITEGSGDLVEKTGKVKNFALLNLIGDGLHNFLDGTIIMVGFLTGYVNGIIITLAVSFHELPQELGDFRILVYGVFSKKRALFWNFISAMVVLLGGIFAFFLANILESFKFFFLAFSGGGFLYIASTELMPKLIKQKNLKKSIIQTLTFLAGLILIISMVILLPHE